MEIPSTTDWFSDLRMKGNPSISRMKFASGKAKRRWSLTSRCLR